VNVQKEEKVEDSFDKIQEQDENEEEISSI